MVGYYENQNIVEPIHFQFIDEERAQELWPVQMDVIEAFELIDQYNNKNQSLLTEAEGDKSRMFTLEVMDIPKFIKNNDCKPITNPTFFGTSGAPTPDGLLSNEIFGITQADRAGIFAYIDLVEYFIDPSCYKALTRIDKKFIAIVHASKRFKIDEQGVLVENPNGGTGIKWLKQNFGKLSFFKPLSTSRKRDMKVEYIKRNYSKGRLFINKYLVIPPYYRDVNTSGNHPGVGQINTLYNTLIVSARSLKENNDYGLSMADTTCARIQETLKAIYDWFCGNNNPTLADTGSGMSGKFGIIRRANLSKTSDYSSRLIITAPELKVESADSLMANLDKSAAPLAAVVADFFPFMMFHMRKFFENEFLNITRYPVLINDEIRYVPLKNALQTFNDDVLKKAMKRFLYSDDNRVIPIEAPIDYEAAGLDRSTPVYMAFRGTDTPEQYGQNVEPITQRPLTWVDVIFISAVRAVEGKTISITRYPYDSFYNTFYTEIEVASMHTTEPLYINGIFYQFYPKIRNKDILMPSAEKFVDTMQVCNLYLRGMGGDYDGDTIVMKGSFFKETNEELKKFVQTKVNYIDMGCSNVRVSNNEAVQAIYNLTKILYADKEKLSEPVF